MTTDEAICIGNFIEAMEKLHKPIVIRMCWLDVSELQTSAALVWMEEPQDDDSCSTGKSVGRNSGLNIIVMKDMILVMQNFGIGHIKK